MQLPARDTKLGGHITQDVTQGYGPEMFTLPKAAAGKHEVRVKYFAHDANRASTRMKVYATIYEGVGTPQEKVGRCTRSPRWVSETSTQAGLWSC